MTKILIVEDEASFSEALEFLLGKRGFLSLLLTMVPMPCVNLIKEG